MLDEGCKEDRDCPSKEVCIVRNNKGDCKNPCTTFTPCVANAECKVYDTLPLRTMSCTCLPGFTGKGDQLCQPISKSCHIIRYLVRNKMQNGAQSVDFFVSQLLLFKQAVHQMMNAHQVKHAEIGLALILAVRKILAVQVLDAQLLITSQLAHVPLALKVIHTPDVSQVSPLTLVLFEIKSKIKMRVIVKILLCFSTLVKKGECNHDSECPDNKACNQYQCINPCLDGSPCGKNAECEAKGHRAVCRCPSGWGGHPSTECFTCRLKNTVYVAFTL